MIPMRDGVRLHTKIFVPREQTTPLPIIVKRTPYGIEGSANNFNAYFKALADEGYIFVFQDIRGKFKSEGTFVMQRPVRLRPEGFGATGSPGDTKSIDEGTDTYASIDWLLKNLRNNNGRVGMLGVSYDGWTTTMGAIEPHPALRAISPRISITSSSDPGGTADGREEEATRLARFPSAATPPSSSASGCRRRSLRTS